ncbi:MAG: hypothetical protein HYY06_33660 [Deltaproteobacteria bacterium]|nr:hypothetical protein [Deltaproteobacteria bacterium]
MLRWAMVLAVLTIAPGARAQNRQLIIIELSDREPADTALVDAADRVTGGGGLSGSDLSREIDDRILRPARESDRSGLEALLTTVEQGIEGFYENRFPEAVDKLTRASTALAEAIDVVGMDQRTATALFEASMILAVTLRYLRDEVQARDVLRRVIRLFPSRRPMLAQFSPDLIRLYDEVKAEMDAAPMAQVNVETRPSGCHVLCNGQEAGTSPWEGTIYPGDHTFQVRCDGRLSGVRRANLQAGRQQVEIDFEAAQALHADRLPWIARGRSARRVAAALARDLGSPETLLVERRGQRVAIQAIRAGSPRIDRWGEGETAAVAWANMRAAPEDGRPEPTPPSPTPWFRDIGAWASLGLGAAAAVSGLALVQSAREDAWNAQVAGTAQEHFDLADSANDTGTPAVLLATGGTSLVLGGIAALVVPSSGHPTTFHGPLFWLLSAAGVLASGLGVGLLLLDGCDYGDHPLCPAVPGEPFATNAPAGLILTASGAVGLATALVLRLTEGSGEQQ